MKDDTRLKNAKESFLRDDAKLWNNVPTTIETTKSLSLAKTQILNFCKKLFFDYKYVFHVQYNNANA